MIMHYRDHILGSVRQCAQSFYASALRNNMAKSEILQAFAKEALGPDFPGFVLAFGTQSGVDLDKIVDVLDQTRNALAEVKEDLAEEETAYNQLEAAHEELSTKYDRVKAERWGLEAENERLRKELTEQELLAQSRANRIAQLERFNTEAVDTIAQPVACPEAWRVRLPPTGPTAREGRKGTP